MSKSIKWLLISLVTLLITPFIILFIGFFLLAYTLDGREYTKENIFDYYILTPNLIMNAPNLSNKTIYYTRSDDNYGFTEDKITWEQVTNTSLAQKRLEKYLADQGIQINKKNDFNEEYLIVSYENTISLQIITHTGADY